MNLQDIEEANVKSILKMKLHRVTIARIAAKISKDPFKVLAALDVHPDPRMLITLFKRGFIKHDDVRVLNYVALPFTFVTEQRARHQTIRLFVVTNHIPQWFYDLLDKYDYDDNSGFNEEASTRIYTMSLFGYYAINDGNMELIEKLSSRKDTYRALLVTWFAKPTKKLCDMRHIIWEYEEKYGIRREPHWQFNIPMTWYYHYHGTQETWAFSPKWYGEVDQFIRLLEYGIIKLPIGYRFDFCFSAYADIYDYYKLIKRNISVFINYDNFVFNIDDPQRSWSRNAMPSLFVKWHLTGCSRHPLLDAILNRMKARYRTRAAICIQRAVRRYIIQL